MKQRVSQSLSVEPTVTPSVSLRLEKDLSQRVEKVVVKSKRSRTSIIEECVEKALPDLEKQYAKAA